MKAVVIARRHEAAWVELERPVTGPDDVLVRSHVAGVCRTDLEILSGQLSDPRFVKLPVVPGHEWSGTVAEAGERVRDFAPGDRVVCEGVIPCHRCRRCRAGETNLCENHDELGFTRGGGYGEYVLVPGHVVHRLPEGVSFAAAVLVEPSSCVLRGLERGRPQPGETVGVIGIGTLGSLALTLAGLFGPGALVAYGIRPEELSFAERLGAHTTVNVAELDGVEETRRLLGGGLDLVLETAGSVAAVDLATRLVRPGGRVVLLGVSGEGRTLELPPDRITLGDLEVIGSCSYTSSVWGRVMRLLERDLVSLDSIVTHRFPAARFEEAFRLLEQRDGVVGKVLLEHVPS